MAVTVKQKYDTVGTTQTVTGTPGKIVYGPPAHGNPKSKGVYICEAGRGTTSTFRWIEDITIDASLTAPAGWTATF